MRRGFFTQSAMILLEQAVTIDDVAAALSQFTVARRIDAKGESDWLGGRPALLLAMRPEVNGYVLVDALDQPWPDSMGDPKADPKLFGAWGTGWFGPFVYPGNLKRAAEQSWSWNKASQVTAAHTAFVRIKSSYVLGGETDLRTVPDDYDALQELRFVTDVARTLLGLPQALCYFNPNGETLHTRQSLESSLAYHAEHRLPPLDIWTNIRMFQIPEIGWTLMDTVGMGQLDVNDQEAVFRTGSCKGPAICNFLRNSTDYVRQKGPIILDSNTMDGAGIRWQARSLGSGMVPPPRPVLRWLPQNEPSLPTQFLAKTA